MGNRYYPSVRLQRAGCKGPSLAPDSPALKQLHGQHKGQMHAQPNVSTVDGCYLEWSRWAADVNMGLLHQMGSLGCALADAFSLNRTLLLPTHICGYRHNKRLKGQAMCARLDELFDLSLLSQLVPVRLGSSEIQRRNRAVNYNCPSADARSRYPCTGGGDHEHGERPERLITRAVTDEQFWMVPCTIGTVDVEFIRDRVIRSFGSTRTEGTRLAPHGSSLLQSATVDPAPGRFDGETPRGVAFTLLRSGLFFTPALKAAAAEMRARMGPYVHLHVRRGDRITHSGSAPGVDWRLRQNLTQGEAIASSLRLWFPRGTTIYVAPSDDPPTSFASLARDYRVFFAENFTSVLGDAYKSTYQLFATELLLSLGSEAYVETFASQLPLFRQSCFPAQALAAANVRRATDVNGGPGISVTRVNRVASIFEVNGVTYGRACLRNTPCENAAHELYLVGTEKHPWPRGCGEAS